MSDRKDFIQAMGGAQRTGDRPALTSVEPADGAGRALEAEHSAKRSEPAPASRMRSVEDMRRRVRQLRRQYEPFLADNTPPEPAPRPVQHLRSMSFRFIDGKDERDREQAKAGLGAWDPVCIPHYTGPTGRWRAFYRTVFILGEEFRSRERVYIVFRGVDYTARVFVNGVALGRHDGFFAPFEFDVTDIVDRDHENVLLVEVSNDAIQMGNLSWDRFSRPPDAPAIPEEELGLEGRKVYGATGLGWDDPYTGWTHCPPGGGIWQPVYLEGRSAVSVASVFAQPAEDRVRLEVELWNALYRRTSVRMSISIYPRNFDGPPLVEEKPVDSPPAGPDNSLYQFEVPMPDARPWEPERPFLYTVRVTVEDEFGDRDQYDQTFGMRTFAQDTDGSPKGTFLLNGRPVFLRGANTMGHLQRSVFEGDIEQLVEDVLIAKAANLTFFRLTQRPVQDEVYRICDCLGMMLQTDLPAFKGFRWGAVEEVARQAGEMERLVRNHPSNVVVTLINEPFPAHWDPSSRHRIMDRESLERLFENCMNVIRYYNPDRVVKCADGDYDPPARHGMTDEHAYAIWHDNHGLPIGKLHRGYLWEIKPDWKTGCGEYGAEGLEPWETMKRHYPADWLPEDIDDPWDPIAVPRSQASGWQHQWFERPTTAREWIEATWKHQSWGVKFETEAFRRRADLVISHALHLLINGWPNNWLKALVSVDRTPLPAYFAYADALRPLVVLLRTDRHAVFGGEEMQIEVWVANDTAQEIAGLSLVYWIEIGGSTEFIQETTVAAPAAGSELVGHLRRPTPAVDARTDITVRAALVSEDGTTLHDNSLTIGAYPAPDRSLLSGQHVAVAGRDRERAVRLAEYFGAPATTVDPADISALSPGRTPLLLVTDSAQPAGDSPAEPQSGEDAAISRYLEAGGRVLFLAQSGTDWRRHVGGRTVAGERIHSPHHFVSRKTGHPVAEQFDSDDFFLWYNGDFIDHLVYSGLSGADLTPITLTGRGIWYAPVEHFPASAESAVGEGVAIFNQVVLSKFLDSEPRAALYAQALIVRLLNHSHRREPR